MLSFAVKDTANNIYYGSIDESSKTVTCEIPDTVADTTFMPIIVVSTGATYIETTTIEIDIPIDIDVRSEDQEVTNTYTITLTKTPKAQLDTPTNLSLESDGTASWNSVVNTSSYVVYLYKDGNLVEIINVSDTGSDPEYNITDKARAYGEGVYTFSVMAKPAENSQSYINSAMSDPSIDAFVLVKNIAGVEITPSTNIAIGQVLEAVVTDGDNTPITSSVTYIWQIDNGTGFENIMG